MFKEKYTLKIGEAIYTPIIYREHCRKYSEMPPATLNNIYKFCEYCGYTNGAVRTAISRMKKTGDIFSYKENGKVRYNIPKIHVNVEDNYDAQKENEGYTLIVYSFTKDDSKIRNEVREALEYIGFRRFSQNTFIGRKILGTEFGNQVKERLKEKKLDENVFMFNVENITDEKTTNKIKSIWKLDEWEKLLEEFLFEVKKFLDFDGISDEEVFNRANYIGAVAHLYIKTKIPPIMFENTLKNKLLKEINEVIMEFDMKSIQRMSRYFTENN